MELMSSGVIVSLTNILIFIDCSAAYRESTHCVIFLIAAGLSG